MLTEERHHMILQELKQKGMITVLELVDLLKTSESTIRRDLLVLQEKNQLQKVHGGAISLEKAISHTEYQVQQRELMNEREKIALAKYAANLIKDDEIVYIDAGTTTKLLIDYIQAKDIVAVTNGIDHAKQLVQKGIQTFILGGEIKQITEAVVGVSAVKDLDKYNFSRSFLGANGVHAKAGYTTPDVNEAMVKQKAVEKSKKAYILADHTKIEEISFASFAEIDRAILITDAPSRSKLANKTKIIEVSLDD